MALLSPTNPLLWMPQFTGQPPFNPFQFATPPAPFLPPPQQQQPGLLASPQGLLGGQGDGGGGNGGQGPGPGPAGTGSAPSSSGVSPAGVSGNLGLGHELGPAASAVPGGIGMLGINNAVSAVQANNDLSKIGAPTLGLNDVLKGMLSDLTMGILGKDITVAAEQANNSTPAAEGIGTPSGSSPEGESPGAVGAAAAAGGDNGVGGSGPGGSAGPGEGTGGGSNGPGDGPGPGGGQGGPGDGGDGGFSAGGVIKKVKGKNPKGPDQGTITAQRGEAVLNRGAVGLLGSHAIGLLNAAGQRRGLLGR